MSFRQLIACTIFLTASAAEAATEQDKADCLRGPSDAKVRGCTAVLDDPRTTIPNRAVSLSQRASAYLQMKELDRAFRDANEAIRLNPDHATAYAIRGEVLVQKDDPDRALADFNAAYQRNLRDHRIHQSRGRAYLKKNDVNNALAEFSKAIQLNEGFASAYANRAIVHEKRGDVSAALADYDAAIRHGLNDAKIYFKKGLLRQRKGQHDLAIGDFQEALRRSPAHAPARNGRGEALEALGRKKEAFADYDAARGFIANPTDSDHEQGRALARTNYERLRAEMQKEVKLHPTPPISAAPVPSSGVRIALVVGNSRYKDQTVLANPANDAKVVARKFRALGFQEVVEAYDADLKTLSDLLKDFGDKSERTDWSVVFFAGHGIEVNGVNYLIPIDARLARDTHVKDETVSLDRVLEKVQGARKLRLVILDACRNNPFVARMLRSSRATRSIGSGLASAGEPDGGVLVVYAAKHGTTALDGTGGGNSPFTDALLRHIDEPGLDITTFVGKIRQNVLRDTNGAQEPFLYGAPSAERHCFSGC
jgi:tetratricopeptide (TPR) repeat protein